MSIEPVDKRCGNNFEIYVMNADGSNPTRLTVNNATITCSPWSPSTVPGSRSYPTVRMRRQDMTAAPPCDIYVMKADGTKPTRLTTHGVDSRIAWSPDGSRLAYMTADLGDESGFNQTDPSTVRNRRGPRLRHPIAFTAWQNSADRILVMKADGTNPTFLVDGSQPTWSPDSVPDRVRRGKRHLQDKH